MIADAMVDTNVLVYAASRLAEDQDKARVANALLQTKESAFGAGAAGISGCLDPQGTQAVVAR